MIDKHHLFILLKIYLAKTHNTKKMEKTYLRNEFPQNNNKPNRIDFLTKDFNTSLENENSVIAKSIIKKIRKSVGKWVIRDMQTLYVHDIANNTYTEFTGDINDLELTTVWLTAGNYWTSPAGVYTKQEEGFIIANIDYFIHYNWPHNTKKTHVGNYKKSNWHEKERHRIRKEERRIKCL